MRVTLDTSGDTITLTRHMDGVDLGRQCITEKDALARLLRKVPASGILPPSLRWVSPSGAQAIFERAPCRIKIRYAPAAASMVDGVETQIYELPLPWTVYGVSQAQQGTAAAVYLFAIPKPLQSMEDVLYHLPLTNLYHDGRFCIPSHNDRATNLAELVDLTLRLVWSSGFNLDMASALDLYRQRRRPHVLMRNLRGDLELADGIAPMLQRWSQMSVVEASKLDWCPASSVTQLTGHLHAHSEGSRSPGALMTIVSTLGGAGGNI